MKRILLLISAILICITSSGKIKSGTCGKDITWVLEDDYTLVLSGTGVMNHYMRELKEYAPWSYPYVPGNDYSKQILKVIVGEGITDIGRESFYRCSNLSSITIPNSVLEIGTEAFRECSSLNEVNLPNSLTNIGYGAFYGCSSLTSITLPSSVVSLGSEIIYNCKNVKEIRSLNSLPPTCSSSTFNGVDKNQTIVYVPKGSKDYYAKAIGWKDFICILEEGETEEIKALKSQIEALEALNASLQSENTTLKTQITTLTTENATLKTELDDLSTKAIYDLNGDKKITIADVTTLIDAIVNQ